MSTDTRLRHLKPKEKLYKVNDRDGLYVAVTPAGTISFRYNYSINGRQETVTFGRYGVGGITLAEARERLNEAKKMVAGGRSSAREKTRDKARIKDAETFGAWAEKWLRGYQMAESTRDMRRSVLSGIVGGASLQGVGGFGAGMITGAAATSISGAGAMAMGASAQVSGGASTLKAAFESAQAAMAEEAGSGGVIGGGEDTGSVDTSREQPSGKGSSSRGSEGFAASFSRAGRMASHMGNSMSNGAAEYQRMKRSSNSSRAQQTFGGELATQIRKQTATRRDNRGHDDFAGDNLSGNNKS